MTTEEKQVFELHEELKKSTATIINLCKERIGIGFDNEEYIQIMKKYKSMSRDTEQMIRKFKKGLDDRRKKEGLPPLFSWDSLN